MSTNEILRKKLEGNSIIKVGGAFDAMSAKLVENSGFDAVWAGSFAISATHALPDASILTMTEFFDVASNMSSTCEIPIIADCDTGYGGPSNVHHMTRKYENAGISSICIEDKTFPKQNSLLENGKNDLLSEKEFVAKILAAKEARSNKNFIIIARVEALISGAGMKEAIKRANAYENAGADAILIHSKQKTPDEIFEFTDSWKGSAPIVVVPTTYDSVKISDLSSHNIKMVIYANQTLRAAYSAMNNMLKEIKDGIVNKSFSQLIIYSISRLGRSMIETISLLNELTDNGINVISLKENLDLSTPSGKMISQIFSVLAEYELNSLRKIVSDNLQSKKRNAIKYTKSVYGFDFHNKKMVVNEKEQKVIRKIFKMYNNGTGFTGIANHLNKNGHSIKNGNPFSRSYVRNILQNKQKITDKNNQFFVSRTPNYL